MHKYLFIGGAGHSGTTMLNHAFANHPASLSANGETRLATSIGLIKKEYEALENNKDRYAYITDKIYNGYGFLKQQYSHASQEENPFRYPNFKIDSLTGNFKKDIKPVIDAALKNASKTLYVEKTPSNVFHIPEITSAIPDAKILIIHRDVRDVVASLKKRYLLLQNNPKVYAHNLEAKKLDKDYNLVIDAMFWSKAVKKAPKSAGQIKVVLYETLVRQPQKELKAICNWIGIPFSDELMNISNSNSSDLNVKESSGFSVQSINTYKKTLNNREIAVVQRHAAFGLNQLAYPLDKVGAGDLMISYFLQIKSYGKVFSRVYKRARLMNPTYLRAFSKRFVQKLFS